MINDLTKRNFINQVSNIDFEGIITGESINVNFKMFLDLLFKAYKNYFPIKRKRVREGDGRVTWMTRKLKFYIRVKCRLFNLSRRGLIQIHPNCERK